MNKEKLKDVYRKRASAYNDSIKLFNFIGWRVNFYRVKAVDALSLKKGDTVVDLCCGTGLNFPYLQQAISEEGNIIGVDLSADMLREAEKLVKSKGWKNITLLNEDVAKFNFPKKTDGLISSYGITLIPEYDAVISRGAVALNKGGKFVILDFKKPENWPDWFAKIMVRFFVKPYGGSYNMKDRHAWESLEKHLHLTGFKEYYFDSTYIAIGEK